MLRGSADSPALHRVRSFFWFTPFVGFLCQSLPGHCRQAELDCVAAAESLDSSCGGALHGLEAVTAGEHDRWLSKAAEHARDPPQLQRWLTELAWSHPSNDRDRACFLPPPIVALILGYFNAQRWQLLAQLLKPPEREPQSPTSGTAFAVEVQSPLPNRY